MSKELKPCPFCGGEAIIHTIEPHTHAMATFMPDYKGSTFIECTSCTCMLSEDAKQEAIDGCGKGCAACWNQEVLE